MTDFEMCVELARFHGVAGNSARGLDGESRGVNAGDPIIVMTDDRPGIVELMADRAPHGRSTTAGEFRRLRRALKVFWLTVLREILATGSRRDK
jgi:hypothetical protein